jgi:PleD family two-component response regulator
MRVLVADDDAAHRRTIERRLESWGFACVGVADGMAAAAALGRDGAPRLALMRSRLPGQDGLALCRALRADELRPYTYVILWGEDASRTATLGALHAGADEYLTAPIDPEILHLRLFAGRRVVDLQEQLIAAREAMRFQSEHDVVTGLPTRDGSPRLSIPSSTGRGASTRRSPR